MFSYFGVYQDHGNTVKKQMFLVCFQPSRALLSKRGCMSNKVFIIRFNTLYLKNTLNNTTNENITLKNIEGENRKMNI